MIVKFIKGWRQFRPGDTTDAIPDGVAELLKLRGRCIEYMVPPVTLEVDLVQEPRPPKRARVTT